MESTQEPDEPKTFIKTPGHTAWNTIFTAVKYNLQELREFITVSIPKAKALIRSYQNGIVPDCRHTSCFNLVRRWAYDNVEKYKLNSDLGSFFEDMLVTADEYCRGVVRSAIPHKPVLPASEQVTIVHSIAPWTWIIYDGRKKNDPAFSELQKKRITKRWGDNDQSRKEAQALRAQGLSHQRIADLLGFSKRTIIRWLS